MRFIETNLDGLYVIENELIKDNRGFFTRVYCDNMFSDMGLETMYTQINMSHNDIAHTWRGLHWQEDPYAEVKVVRCTKGSIWDVAVDLRKFSNSRCLYYSTVLSAANQKALYIPEGFAHGYLTLEDDTDVLYQVSEPYTKRAEKGARYDDPAFNIQLPYAITVISARDLAHPKFEV